MVKRVLIAVGLAVVMAACSDSGGTAADNKQPTVRQVESVTPSTTPTDPLDRYNPEHDPNKCIRILDDGTVVFTIIEPVPPGTPMNPAAADEPTTPVPPLGKCG